MFAKEINFHTVDVDGTKINFPFEPYELQISYMKKVLECVRDGKNGLLESPTGTGKTLSLLCSSLAWLEHAKAMSQMAKLKAGSNPELTMSPDAMAVLGVRHKIIYSSRTHSQLSQAMAELTGTTYRYMKVAILGSRDQLCVNPAVMEAGSSREKLNMCQARVKAKTCVYHQNVEKHKDRPELRDNQILDIEDLHKLGKKHTFCPYYMSRELYQTADVIFLPYNYLLDPKTRKTLDLDLTGAVLIFDEAHNIQKLCEESASVSINLSDLALAIEDINSISEELADPTVSFDEKPDLTGAMDISETEMLAVKGFLLEIESTLDNMMKNQKSMTKTGSFISQLFGQFQNARVQHTLELMVNYANGSNEGAMSSRGRGLNKVADLISIAFNQNVTSSDLETLFKVHLNKEEKSDGGKGFLKSKSETVTLNLWCFSPGLGMQRLAKEGARSIILTSGTLSPLSAFEEEIGIPFPVHLENKHIVSASQVWCGVVSNGPDGTLLNSSFRCRSDPKYLSSLGQSVINIIRVVPNGVLIFFPSYSLMKSVREAWQNSGLWSKLEGIKPVFLEPQRKDALAATMRDYYAAAKDVRGACFMAVCRGKVAEGLDFADDFGRAVLITGLPYPPLKDARVELKRLFLDDTLKKSGKTSLQGMSGSKWYSLEAFRATNQAIGRVIRHSRDHGAIVFLDNRFGDIQARQAMSRWLQPFFQNHAQIGAAIKGMASFFKTDSLIGKQRGDVIAEQTAMMNNSKGLKRCRVEVNYEEETVPVVTATDYAGGALDHPTTAGNIFATSSDGINFQSQSSTADEHVFLAPKPVTLAQSMRKKKIKVAVKGFPSVQPPCGDENGAKNVNASKSPLSSGEQSVHSSADSAQDVAKKYVALLKDTLTGNEFILFKQAIKYYKSHADLKHVTSILDTVMVKYIVGRPELLTGFSVFIKKHHQEEFEKFCELTISMAGEVTQIMIPDKKSR